MTPGPNEEAADAAPPVTDELPHDLDVTAYVGPYTFPDPARRRGIAIVHLVAAAVALAAWVSTDSGAFLVAAGLLAGAAALHLSAGWRLRVNENQALVTAVQTVGFPVGHASAQLAFRGVRSRPTWRVLLYSADDPPTRRGLVEMDAVDGRALGHFVEDNPEDWEEFGASR